MRPEVALFANSLRCNGASAAEGRPSVADNLLLSADVNAAADGL